MDACRSKTEISVSLPSAATEEVLVEAAKLGDRSAFVELWKRHSNTAFRMACQITRNRADAEDVVQEAWMNAYVHLQSFHGRAAFSTWITRIAINAALMMLRRRRGRLETPMEVTDGEIYQHWEIVDPTKDVEKRYVMHEDAERLKRAICRLKPTLRIVLEMHQSTDRSLKEVAEFAGISIAATKSRLTRARRILRTTLDHNQVVKAKTFAAKVLIPTRIKIAYSPYSTTSPGT